MTANDPTLPMGWTGSKLGELGRYLNGRGFAKSEWSDRGRPIIRIQDLTGLTANPNYFEGEVEDRHVVRPGDFLVSWAATLGAFIWRGPEGVLNQHIFKVQTQINQRFHYYAVTNALEDMCRRTRGTGMVHIIKKDFDATSVPLPPLAEQARIANRIDELFTDLAAGVAALERVKRNLTRYRAAVLHAAVTGQLTEAWRKQHGPAAEPGPKLLERILAERRRQWEGRTQAKYEKAGKQPPKNWRDRYSEPSQPKPPTDGSPLPVLAEGWCWANLDCLKQFSMYGPRFSSDAYVSDGVRVLRTTDFDDAGNIDLSTPPMLPLTDAQIEDYGLEPGDLLVTRTGSLGTLAVFQGGARAIAGAFLIYYRLNHEHVDPRFAFFVLKAPAGQRELRRRGTGVGRPNLNIPSIDSIEVPLPPLNEQSAIVEAVNEKLSQIDALEAEVARGLARASRLRQAILKAAFEGRLVPQDPRDEPASVLLERVRADAAATAHRPKLKPRNTTSRKAATR